MTIAEQLESLASGIQTALADEWGENRLSINARGIKRKIEDIAVRIRNGEYGPEHLTIIADHLSGGE